jgi:L-threonylcarbamoyladenylate synthase
MLESLVSSVPEDAQKLMDAFWPGPLTLLLPKKSVVPEEVTCGQPTVAIRMPSHPIAVKLIHLSQKPIAAPSANLSGRPSPTTAQHVFDDLNGRVQCILDGGACEVGLESTVVDVNRRYKSPHNEKKEKKKSVDIFNSGYFQRFLFD